jgi:hypothetical protein
VDLPHRCTYLKMNSLANAEAGRGQEGQGVLATPFSSILHSF